MTRKFRLGLFVSLAGAVGLHARPCWTCCWIPSWGACDAPEDSVAVHEGTDAQDRVTAAALNELESEGRVQRVRPDLRSMWRSTVATGLATSAVASAH